MQKPLHYLKALVYHLKTNKFLFLRSIGMMTDTISDMLTRIRNANLAKHQIVQIPSTKLAHSLATVLVETNYVESCKVLKEGTVSSLVLSLKYHDKTRTPHIKKIMRISKPGLRVYTNSKKMPRVLGGFGTAIVSTSKGLMTDKKARDLRIGGELICYIW